MNIKLNNNTKKKLHLSRNELVQFKKFAPGTEFSCERGILWITQKGDPQDYILTPGKNLVIRKHGSILMEALLDVDFQVGNLKDSLN
jgi:hypothetical protein